MKHDPVALGGICTLNPRKPNTLDPDTQCSFVPMEHIDDQQGVVKQKAIRRIAEVEKGFTYFQNGDVLFAKITPCMENGKCAIADNLLNGVGFGSTEFHVIRAGNHTIPGWIYYYLRQKSTRRRAERAMTGSAGQKRVPLAFLEDAIIPLPPLPEQQRIAAILAKADRLRRQRRYALELSAGYLQAVFLEMFGDPVRNERGWETDRLGNHLVFVTSGSRGWARYYASAGERFIRSYDVQMNYISDDDKVYVVPPRNAEANRTVVRSGDVLLTITGARIGRVAYVSETIGQAYVSQHVAILRLRETLVPVFLSMFLSQERGGQRQILSVQYGQTKPGLNFEQIRSFKILIPPLLRSHTAS
jgi:type I restriction enzyme S subunit